MISFAKREKRVESKASQYGVLLFALVWVLGAAACQPVAPPHPRSPDIVIRADAGQDFTVQIGKSPAFDGCGSVGEITNYTWTIDHAPASMPEYDGKVIRAIDPNCSFTLEASMLADEAGMWVVELTVRDAKNRTSTDSVNIDVVP